MWGAEVREFEGDIQFKNPGEDWKFATAKNPKHKLGIDPIEEKYLHVDQDMAKPVVKKYVQNDFGETGFRVEGSPGLFIHTGPESEDKLSKSESEEELTCSHGCLHVQLAKRNELMTEGYLQKGVTIVIKGYKDVLDPGSPNYGKSTRRSPQRSWPSVPTSLETVRPRYLSSDGRRMVPQACRSQPKFLVERPPLPPASASSVSPA